MHPQYIQARDSVAIAGARAFEVVAYTGGELPIHNWEFPVVVDLAGLTLGKSIVANLDHDSSKRVGIVSSVDNNGRRLLLKGNLSAATDARREVVESYKNGFNWQASVEVSPTKVDEIAAGKSITANGQTFKGPLYVTRRGVLKGFAFVSHGADDSTEVSIAASRRFTPRPENVFNLAPGTVDRMARWLR